MRRRFTQLLLAGAVTALAGCGAEPASSEGGADAAATDTAAADAAPDDTTASASHAFEPAPVTANGLWWDFFRLDRVHPVELRVSAEEWQGLIDDMLDYAAVDGYMRTGRYRRATFVYARADGGEEVLGDVGIRTRGNTTRVVPQDPDGTFHRAHFKIRFNETFDLDPARSAADDRSDRRWRGVRALNLKWPIEDDATQIREMYAYELLRRAGLRVPRTAPVALTITIDGAPAYFGLYLAIENVDKSFLKMRYGADRAGGDLYKCLWQNHGPATLEPIRDARAVGVKDWESNYRPAYDLRTNEDSSEHEALFALIEQLDALEGEGLAGWLEAHFDVEQLLRFVAMNVLIGMPDDYWAMGNNYYLYFPDGERAELLPWDYDHGLGGGWAAEPTWSYEGIATADVFTWKNLNAAFGRANATHPLVDNVLAIPAYRARYVELLEALIDPETGVFSWADYEAFFAAQVERLAPWLDNVADEGEEMVEGGQTRWYMETKVRSVAEQLGLDPDRYVTP